ncbi:MAG: hypothetical protein ACI8RY_001662 [Urechidicola sp.]|jgi:hypothetical protein
MKNIFYLTVLMATLYSCKTDFEINAAYKKIPIIYGVLDQSVDTQFIKINKSFLGTNNSAYSSVNDSMYFDDVTVRIEELDDDENVLRLFSLQEKFVPVPPGSGIFFTGQQKVYYFTDILDETKEYKIVGEGDGQPFSATTNLIADFGFELSFKNGLQSPRGIGWYNSGVYSEVVPKWRQSDDGEVYDATVRFNYTEYRNGIATPLSVDWYMGSVNSTGSGTLSIKSDAESFFAFLSNSTILQDTIGVTKRVIGKIEFRITSINQILETYIDINKPNNAIAFDKPDYTNIEGGRGIFGSRYTSIITSNQEFNDKTTEHLCFGSYTGDFKFCSNNNRYNTEAYYCP